MKYPKMEKLEKVDFCLALFDKKSKEPNWGELRTRAHPGAHIAAVCPKSSYHRITAGIEAAGFEIRDCLLFLGNPSYMVCIARKSLAGTIVENVRRFGTGCLNVDACRVNSGDNPKKWEKPRGGIWKTDSDAKAQLLDSDMGRFPANVVHSNDDPIVEQFPVGKPSKASMRGVGLTGAEQKVYGKGDPSYNTVRGHNDDGGSVSRFFYHVPEKNKVLGLCKYLCLLCATGESSVVTVNVGKAVQKELGEMVALVEDYDV